MPLISVEDVRADTRLGLWSMADGEDDGSELYREASAMYKSASRRREYVGVRLLLRAMTGCQCLEISHDANGRPRLSNNLNISISHTRDVCAVIVSKEHDVAVDVEYVSERVNKIASKILRDDERATDARSRLLHWCAKETAYKLFPDDELAFDEMQVVGIRQYSDMSALDVEHQKHTHLPDGDRALTTGQQYIAGSIRLMQLRRGIAIDISSRVYPEHILTFAVL